MGVSDHLMQIEEFANEKLLFCKMLIGNKMDLAHKRNVDTHQAMQIAQQFDVEYMEVSAKTGQNIDDMFKKAASCAVLKKRKMEQMMAEKMAAERKHSHRSADDRQF